MQLSGLFSAQNMSAWANQHPLGNSERVYCLGNECVREAISFQIKFLFIRISHIRISELKGTEVMNTLEYC